MSSTLLSLRMLPLIMIMCWCEPGLPHPPPHQKKITAPEHEPVK